MWNLTPTLTLTLTLTLLTQAAMAVWNRCNVDKKGLDHTCLANDFKKKLTDKVEDEVMRMGRNPDPDPDHDPDPGPLTTDH